MESERAMSKLSVRDCCIELCPEGQLCLCWRSWKEQRVVLLLFCSERSPFVDNPGMSPNSWTQTQSQKTREGLCIPLGLRMPQDPPSWITWITGGKQMEEQIDGCMALQVFDLTQGLWLNMSDMIKEGRVQYIKMTYGIIGVFLFLSSWWFLSCD